MTSHNHSLRILGLSGSLRPASFNTALLVAARGLVPDGLSIEVAPRRRSSPAFGILRHCIQAKSGLRPRRITGAERE